MGGTVIMTERAALLLNVNTKLLPLRGYMSGTIFITDVARQNGRHCIRATASAGDGG